MKSPIHFAWMSSPERRSGRGGTDPRHRPRPCEVGASRTISETFTHTSAPPPVSCGQPPWPSHAPQPRSDTRTTTASSTSARSASPAPTTVNPSTRSPAPIAAPTTPPTAPTSTSASALPARAATQAPPDGRSRFLLDLQARCPTPRQQPQPKDLAGGNGIARPCCPSESPTPTHRLTSGRGCGGNTPHQRPSLLLR